jgi:hypothetical protein
MVKTEVYLIAQRLLASHVKGFGFFRYLRIIFEQDIQMTETLANKLAELLALFRILTQRLEVFLDAWVFYVIDIKVVKQLVNVFVYLILTNLVTV